MTDLTAEVARSAGAVVREPRSPAVLETLVVDAPPVAEELNADVERLPGWMCAAIICGLASLTWAVIIFAVVALIS